MWRPVKGTRRKIEIERQGAIPHRLPINDAGDASDTVRECGVVGWVTIGLGIAGGDFGRRRRQLGHSGYRNAERQSKYRQDTNHDSLPHSETFDRQRWVWNHVKAITAGCATVRDPLRPPKARSSVETTRLRVSGREQSSFARYPTLSQSARKDGPPGSMTTWSG